MARIRQARTRLGRSAEGWTRRALRSAALAVTLATFGLAVVACGDAKPQAGAKRPATAGSTAGTTDGSVDAGVYGDAVTRVIPLGLDRLDETEPPGPLFVDAGAGSVWVSFHRTHTVSRVDPRTGKTVATIAIDPAPGSTAPVTPVATGAATGGGSIAADDDAVWVLDNGGFAWKIDPESNRIAARVDVPGLGADLGLARRDGFLWVMSQAGWMRIDEATNRVDGPYNTPLVFGFWPGVAASPDAVWYGGTAGALRVDPETGPLVTLVEARPESPGGSPIGLASGRVWGVTDDGVFAIDPATSKAVRWIDKPANVEALRADSSTVADGALWVVAGPADRRATLRSRRQQLVRFDLATGDSTVHDLVNAEFGFTMGVTVAKGSVWVADFARGNLLELDLDA